MTSNTRGRRSWMVAVLTPALFAAGCDTVEPGPQLRFSPASLSLDVGETQDFYGIILVGTHSGTWYVQPNSIQIAEIEITGPLQATLTCNQEGAGAFVLSTLTSQGQASGSFYFVCSY